MTNHVATVAALYEAFGIEVLKLGATDDAVAAEVVVDDGEELHLWSVDDEGRVTRMRHYTDAAREVAAALAGF
ncbi:MAG TPA: hypothetical protein VND45_10195 [Thermoanaerobaculia bacterium]|nr:hypothetical protein [Thermoanaerobaculia bacterium]